VGADEAVLAGDEAKKSCQLEVGKRVYFGKNVVHCESAASIKSATYVLYALYTL